RCEGTKARRCFFPWFAFAFVDRLQYLLPLFFRNVFAAKKVDPEFAVADSHDHLFRGESERAQNVDAERNQFDLRLKRFLADDIGVELIVFAEPASLRTLVPEHLRQAKPLYRLF